MPNFFTAKCLAMKKAAKSGNKQKQKETNAECERLEKEQSDRHKKELEEASTSAVSAEPEQEGKNAENPEEMAAANVVVVEEDEEEGEGGSSLCGFYKERAISSKAAKKQAKQKEIADKMAKAAKIDKANAKVSDKAIEKEVIRKALAPFGLMMYEINADGDCMYNAISHNLEQFGQRISGRKLRKACRDYMFEHPDDFQPFIPEGGGSEAAYGANWEKYLEGVENSADAGGVWGGELELMALSSHLKRAIRVFTCDGERKYGTEFETRKHDAIILAYLRKAYLLGEHYNSTLEMSI